MRKIGIVGGGFAGAMTAVHLIKHSGTPIEIYIWNESRDIARGIAYSPYSKIQLLNVITAKMSAFADQPNHFLEWVMKDPEYAHQDEALVANAFMPRHIYGEYLKSVWKEALALANDKGIAVHSNAEKVLDIEKHGDDATVYTEGQSYIVQHCIIATGNMLPRHPKISNQDFFRSGRYYQNPWSIDSVSLSAPEKDILIIGNGLTMVDTVLGLLEQGYKGNIYSISPNGFNILPHRHNGLKYTKLVEELREDMSLSELARLVIKHINNVRRLGVSAEPIIDSLRPFTQKIWKRLTDKEKEIFMSRWRHLWGVARHRIPLQIHDKIQQMRIDDKLHIYAGRIENLEKKGTRLQVVFTNKKSNETEVIQVDRVINCTGPETNLDNLTTGLLKNMYDKGLISQDKLKLGINADMESFEIIDAQGRKVNNIYTLASNLKGLLWESTAVNELRAQAEQLAKIILSTSS